MKKIQNKVFAIILSLFMLFPLTACTNGSTGGNAFESGHSQQQTHEVSFVYNNGEGVSIVPVKDGQTVSTPQDPQKENYIFRGWYTEPSLVYKYDFSKAVTKSFSLYAKYDLDATTITNKISTDLIKGVVKIYNKSYNTFLGFETSETTSQGSGFCFHIQNGYYYVLTNCHVAVLEEGYDKQKFTIEDYQGVTYDGYLYKNPNKTVSAIASEYDLACLYFKPSSTNVKALDIVNVNPAISDDVISIGAPQGQSNAITYGKINSYAKISLSNTSERESNVTFNVIKHTAYINGGSSGGPLVNGNLRVIGVNYASAKDGSASYAIPAEQVQEFLTTFVYN